MPATASTPHLGLPVRQCQPGLPAGSDIQLLASAVNALEAATHGIIADTGAVNALAIALPTGIGISADA